VALEGPLKDLHIQDVFQLLDLGRKSGVLRVTSELRQTAGTVCFDRGGVVAAAVGSDPQPLGARLVRVGKITAADLDRARGLQTGGDERRLGDILVGLGVVSRRELDRQLKAQIEEAVFELLRWSEGYFRFEEGAPFHASVEAPVRFPTEALLMEAARRIDEWSRIGSKVSHLRLVPRLPLESQSSDPLDLVPFEWEVLAAVDGARDLHSLAEMLGRSEFEVARTVYGLTTAGIVVLDDPAHPGQEVPGGVRSRGRRARGGAPRGPADAGGAPAPRPVLRRTRPLHRGARAVGLVDPSGRPHSRRGGREPGGRAAAAIGGSDHQGAGALP
jgi:hypothetical protein